MCIRDRLTLMSTRCVPLPPNTPIRHASAPPIRTSMRIAKIATMPLLPLLSVSAMGKPPDRGTAARVPASEAGGQHRNRRQVISDQHDVHDLSLIHISEPTRLL